MEPYGFTRGDSPTGLNYIVMLKARLVGDRFCQPGDVIQIHELKGHFHHTDKRLTQTHADALIKNGCAKAHSFKSGDRLVSVEWENAALEAATDPGPPKAERGVTGRQKSGAL